MADTFANVDNQSNPGDRWFLIVPGPTALAIKPRGIVCTVTGNITIEDDAGTPLTVTGVEVSLQPYAMRPNKVTAATGTFYGVY